MTTLRIFISFRFAVYRQAPAWRLQGPVLPSISCWLRKGRA